MRRRPPRPQRVRRRPGTRTTTDAQTTHGARTTPSARNSRPDPAPVQRYEVETVSGLEEYARREIRRRLGKAAQIVGTQIEGRVSLQYNGSIRRFDEFRTAVAVHRVEEFAVPGPRALLGHQHLTRLLAAIQSVLDARPGAAFQTFRIAAAGAGSRVFMRLRQEIADATGLQQAEGAAHLQISVRRSTAEEEGWQALIRTSPMPLSARRWRVCDMPGALNGAVASAMVSLTGTRPTERMLNLCCGSGTLVIERLGMGAATSVTGVDISASALQCADANLRAAGHRSSVSLVQADCARLPIPDASVDTINADLPYGMLRNDSGDIASLYHSALAESARVAAAEASMVLITTRRRALLAALAEVPSWNLLTEIPISIPHSRGYITPQIYLLRRGKGVTSRL